ncbi:MAG TPA: sigma-54-dependent Fis family transcriptional regulator [Verrucomicrobiales bacterium]|nr:sigma-54-dependent Fis family transcriptional regulator [Verrucomicrobiales bacterium]HIL71937.1 sigma-54-dependent Fis family transcriptional regulator [Verrucomicrobiota bacterium]
MEKLLLIDDEPDVQYSFKRIFSSSAIELRTADSGEAGLEIIPGFEPDVVIMDIRMGGMTGLETLRKIRLIDEKLLVIMMTAYGTTQTAIEAMKLGAYEYLLKPFEVPKLKETVFEALRTAQKMKQVVSIQPVLDSEDYDLGIIGKSESMHNVFKMIGQLANTDATALITGESGTGKELVARAIYHYSLRNNRPFLAINCAAIPESLIESELFGHEKGAFTGATSQRIGKFEQCNGGTLFLDEIGDMPFSTQTKILRVLQSGTFDRVGSNHPIKVNIRIIAATNKNLEKAVKNKEFREDLFYRLNVVRIQMPPLKDRPDDIPMLVDYFLAKLAQKSNQKLKTISTEVIRYFQAYSWPGNVRELENIVERALVMAKSDIIMPMDIPGEIVAGYSGQNASSPDPHRTIQESSASHLKDSSSDNLPDNVPDLSSVSLKLFQWARTNPDFKIISAVERELIIHALAETRGNQAQASKLLGITRATLRNRIKKFDIRQAIIVQ